MDDKKNKAKSQPAPAPQPAPQPVQGQPVPQPGAVQYQMPPKKGLSKGALWGIIGGSIGLVVVIVAVVLAVVLMGGPTKQDYRNLIREMNDYDTTEITSALAKTQNDNYQKNVENAINKIDEAHKEFSESKAMKDKELKEAFDKYVSEWNKAKGNVKTYAAAIAGYREYVDKCTGVRSVISYVDKSGAEAGKEFDEKMSGCMSALDKLSKSSDEKVSKFGKAYAEYYKKRKEYYMAMADRLTSRNFSSPSPEYPKYPSVDSPLSSSKLDLDKVSDAYKDFKDLLEEKANK